MEAEHIYCWHIECKLWLLCSDTMSLAQMNHDNAVDMQVKYIKTKSTELQERIGQGGQGSSKFAAIFTVATAIFCNRWSHSLRLFPKIYE